MHGRAKIAGAALVAGLLGGGGALADAPAANGKAGRRSEPSGDLNPTVVTQRLVKELAKGAWPLARFVRPERGVAFIRDGAGDSKGEAVRLCGKALDQRLAALPKTLTAKLEALKESELPIDCSNEPAPPTCRLSGVEEGDETVALVFSLDPAKGLFLDEVDALDCCGLGDEGRKEQEKLVARARKKLAAQGCAK